MFSGICLVLYWILYSEQVCQATPKIRDTDHLFLELPLIKDKLEEYINKMSVSGSWSQNAIQGTYAWLKDGLKPRCITRDLKWGVPVPHEKFKDKVEMKFCIHFLNWSLLSSTTFLFLVLFKLASSYAVSHLIISCQVDYTWCSGLLCVVRCAYWLYIYYLMLYSWLGGMVEEPWKCGAVSVYGKG